MDVTLPVEIHPLESVCSRYSHEASSDHGLRQQHSSSRTTTNNACNCDSKRRGRELSLCHEPAKACLRHSFRRKAFEGIGCAGSLEARGSVVFGRSSDPKKDRQAQFSLQLLHPEKCGRYFWSVAEGDEGGQQLCVQGRVRELGELLC